jgi:hypothetical protein
MCVVTGELVVGVVPFPVVGLLPLGYGPPVVVEVDPPPLPPEDFDVEPPPEPLLPGLPPPVLVGGSAVMSFAISDSACVVRALVSGRIPGGRLVEPGDAVSARMLSSVVLMAVACAATCGAVDTAA